MLAAGVRGWPVPACPPRSKGVHHMQELHVQERKQASEFPQELLNLFDLYVHGEIDRREFLEGAKKFAVGGLTAVAIWEALRPNYAWAQQVPKDDKRIKTQPAT